MSILEKFPKLTLDKAVELSSSEIRLLTEITKANVKTLQQAAIDKALQSPEMKRTIETLDYSQFLRSSPSMGKIFNEAKFNAIKLDLLKKAQK